MNERAAVPYGKSLFYQSPGRTARGGQPLTGLGAEVDSPPDESTSGEADEGSVAPNLRLALYDKLSDGLQKALDNAVQLLDLANQTRSAAHEVAAQMLANAREEQRKLSEANEKLSRERDELRQRITEIREEIDRQEALLATLADRRDALQSELAELERRRRQVADVVQSQLTAISRLQESLGDPTSLGDDLA
ncbi:MAG: hypothetical protein ACUVX1_13455 [Chloroflexota bacterium]